jgi:hypothetical protein
MDTNLVSLVRVGGHTVSICLAALGSTVKFFKGRGLCRKLSVGHLPFVS